MVAAIAIKTIAVKIFFVFIFILSPNTSPNNLSGEVFLFSYLLVLIVGTSSGGVEKV